MLVTIVKSASKVGRGRAAGILTVTGTRAVTEIGAGVGVVIVVLSISPVIPAMTPVSASVSA